MDGRINHINVNDGNKIGLENFGTAKKMGKILALRIYYKDLKLNKIQKHVRFLEKQNEIKDCSNNLVLSRT